MNLKSKYISSAFLLLLTSVVVKVIGAVYKIPLTAFIGAVGRGYFATAYNLCMPIHAVTMGAFPVALSKLVSKYNALDDTDMVLALKRGSVRVMSRVGFVGMAIMLALAVPYSRYIADAPKSIYTILVLAPSILFSSLASSYRGYYEGFMNMVPTAVSQALEALVKMIFGLVFARLSMYYLYNYYSSIGYDNEQALAVMYPFTSAFAMLGVTFGSFVSLVFVQMYYLINDRHIDRVERSMSRRAGNELLSFSFPIMVSCAVQSVFQFLDTASVQYCLGNVSQQSLLDSYHNALDIAGVTNGDLHTYVYGLFSSALDFKNLVPGVTMALGVCAVPAVSSAFELGDTDKLKSLVNSIYKYTLTLSIMGSIALCVFSRDILSLFYGSSSPDIVEGCSALVSAYSLTVPVYCLAGTAIFVVQAVGKPKKSIASYVVSGVIRVVLNVVLIQREDVILMGAVVSGLVGYAVLCVWNMAIANVALDVKAVIIKPALVGISAYFIAKYFVINIDVSQVMAYNLLLRMSLFVVIYCILCFLWRLLKFEEIFCAIKF